LGGGKTMRNVTNPLIEAWEESGVRALLLGAQGAIVRDLVHSLPLVRRASATKGPRPTSETRRVQVRPRPTPGS
jgi:hypothetical protein